MDGVILFIPPFFPLRYYLLLAVGNGHDLTPLLLIGLFGLNVFSVLLLPQFLVIGYTRLICLHFFPLIRLFLQLMFFNRVVFGFASDLFILIFLVITLYRILVLLSNFLLNFHWLVYLSLLKIHWCYPDIKHFLCCRFKILSLWILCGCLS